MNRTNLPTELTSFVGREPELQLIAERLGSAHLVTLTGTGGCGKTRLACQVARRRRRAYPGGVWLVELGQVTEPDLVLAAVAQVVGLAERNAQPLKTRLIDALRPRHVLLVLDNCEHLLEACAVLIATLLRECPRLHILATSRQALGVTGEAIVRVPSLALPGAGTMSDLAALGGIESVRLFVDRASARNAAFTLDQDTANAVVDVCRRLDGIPLALELAAAWVHVLDVRELAARLDDQFRLLTGGSPSAPRRHQTLRALIDWSYDLLGPPEQTLLRRLGVFAGSWSLEAVETVCGAGDQPTLEVLAGLVNQSVVQVEAASVEDSGRRYRLLGPLHEYALERLRASGEEAALRERHRAWLVRLAEEAESRWRGADEAIWLARMDRELDNIRAALDWSHRPAADREDVVAGLRLAAALWWFWIIRAHVAEGTEHLRALLAAADRLAPDAQFERARGLQTAGRLTQVGGDLRAAKTLLEACLQLWQQLDRSEERMDVLHDLGLIAHAEGDLARADVLQSEVVVVARAHDDAVRTYRSLYHLGEVAVDLGQYERAERLLDEGLDGARAAGDPRGTAIAAAALGRVALAGHDSARAAELYAESVRLLHGLDDRRRLAASLLGTANVAFDCRDLERAAQLAGSAERLATALTVSPPPGFTSALDRLRQALERALGPDDTETAWAAGRGLGPDQAIALACGSPALAVDATERVDDEPAPPRAAAIGQPSSVLSAREWQVALLIAEGYSNPRIAEELVITRRTADTHVQNILNKLGLHARAQIAAWTVAQRGDTYAARRNT